MRPILLALVLFSAACRATPPSRFYLLTPIPGEVPAEAPRLAVRLSTVELPRYLSGPEIVTRDGHRLAHAEYDRWAEPLEDNVARVLTKNLAVLMPAARISRHPWEWPGDVDFHVTVSVQRFDVEAGGAVLDARWTVYRSGAEHPEAAHRSTFTQPVEGEGFEGFAASMSACLADLSREIAGQLGG